MAKRNGLSSGHVAGKRKHTFTKEDLEREIRYMDIRAYCLKKMQNTQEFREKNWTMTDYNTRIYMQGIFDACEDVLGWCEGRIDQ
tara:strand:+ start:195 stop:449 length:255 start_codon:yes stop_codon:yes gene_type:complete